MDESERRKKTIYDLLAKLEHPLVVMRDWTIPSSDNQDWNRNRAAATPFLATLAALGCTNMLDLTNFR